MLISQAITDKIIDHNEFNAIIDEEKDYDNQKNMTNESKLSEIEILSKNNFCSFFKYYKQEFYYC